MTAHPALAAFVAVVTGLFFAEAVAPPLPVLAGFVVLTASLLALAVRSHRGVYVAALLLLVGVGAVASRLQEAPAPVAPHCLEGGGAVRARVVGIVDRAVDEDGRLSRRATLALEAQRCAEGWQARDDRVVSNLWAGPAIGHGDRLEVPLRLVPLAAARNPTDRDPVAWARESGLSGRGVALAPYAVIERSESLWAALGRARDAAEVYLETALPPAHAALGKALAVGDFASVEPAVRDAWADAGLSHLLAVSGMHVVIIAALWFFLVYHGLVRLPGLVERLSARALAALLTAPVLVVYCVWAGGAPAAVRSTIMAIAGLLGVALGRPGAAANSLGLAGALMLLWDPTTIYDPSFQLSFVAIAALLVLPMPTPPLESAESMPLLRRLGQRAVTLVVGIIITSVAAGLATAPITAWHFGRVSILAPLTNLVGIPVGGIVATPVALLLSIIGPLFPSLGAWLAAILAGCFSILDGVIAVAGGSGLTTVDVPRPSLVELVAYVAVLAALTFTARAWVSSRRAPRRALAGLAVTLVLLAGAVATRALGGTDPSLRVYFPYVGQGDGAIVLFPDGGSMVVDAGGAFEANGWDPGRGVLGPMLRRLGVRRIDIAVVSHAHPDHIGGLAYLAAHFPIGELWWSGVGGDEPTQRALNQAVLAAGGLVRSLAELPERQSRFGVDLELLHPRSAPGEGPGFPAMHLNDNSLVLRIQHGQRSLLLPGDIERDAEALLAPALPPVDILKSPHHGSRSSSTPALLDAIRPRLVVISCGENNRFGLPDEDVLESYTARGMTTLRTDLDGMVSLRSDGKTWRVATASGAWSVP